MYNGRMAMMGLIAVVTASLASGKDILEVVNIDRRPPLLQGFIGARAARSSVARRCCAGVP